MRAVTTITRGAGFKIRLLRPSLLANNSAPVRVNDASGG